MKIGRNIVWNLLGAAVPAAAALAALPLIAREFGAVRLGVLMITWTIIGFTSLFDFGLGRSITWSIARARTQSGNSDVNTAQVGLMIAAGLGIAGATVLWVSTPSLLDYVLKVPFEMRNEVVSAMHLCALAVFPTLLTIAARGILEGRHQFFRSNIIRMPLGVWIIISPVIAAQISPDLTTVSWFLLGGRFAATAALFWMLRDSLRSAWTFNLGNFLALARFGGWLGLSNIVSPLMNNMDRYLIAALVSASAVAYYGTPQEIVTKTLILPGAVMGVLFPLIASVRGDGAELHRIVESAQISVAVLVAPAVILVIGFAPELTTLWLTRSWAAESAAIAQVLMIGVFANCMAQVPYTLLQASGHPKLTTINQLVELPFFLGIVLLLTWRLGVIGTAYAWSARAIVDALILAAESALLFPQSVPGLMVGFASLLVGMTTLGALLLTVSDGYRHWLTFATEVVVLLAGAKHAYSMLNRRTSPADLPPAPLKPLDRKP